MARPKRRIFLRCHHNNSDDGRSFSIGSKYEVFDETDTTYAVRDDDQMVKYVPKASLNYTLRMIGCPKKQSATMHNAAFQLLKGELR